MNVHRGGCHCGAVVFEVDGEPDVLLRCDCSICTMRGYLHWIVPPDRFRLRSPREALTLYTFNTRTAQHLFCKVCGITSFYVPRSHPDQFSVNANCVEGIDLAQVRIVDFDGRSSW